MSRTVDSIKAEITALQVDIEFGRYESKINGHLSHWLCHSQLIKLSTSYLCAIVKQISICSLHPEDRIEDILLICNIIDNRVNEKDRKYAIEYIKNTVASKHPYGADIKDRIREVTAFTELNF